MYTLFALFDDRDNVTNARRELESFMPLTERPKVAVHEQGIDQGPAGEVPLFETATASTTARCALLGGLVGMIAGMLLVGTLDVVGIGLGSGALFGLTLGVAWGALCGVLAGAAEIDPAIRRISHEVERGSILLVVEPPSPEGADHAEKILHRHSGRVMRRHLVKPLTDRERHQLGLHT